MSAVPIDRRFAAAAAAAIAVSALVQVLCLRGSWFFQDDVLNLANAGREGLSWHFLTSQVGRHFAPGHKLFDWIVLSVAGRAWAGAVLLLVASVVAGLTYLALTMARVFGPRARLALPLLLVGTAWPVVATGQWWASGAHVYPAFAGICGALYHHVAWRQDGRRRDAVLSVAWTAVALLFWIQATLIPAVLLVVAVVAARTPWRRLGPEVLAVVPHVAVVAAYVLYVRSRPYAESTTLPPSDQLVDLARALTLRSTLPSLVGASLPPSGEASRETTMQLVAVVLLAGALASAVVARTRWIAGLVLLALGIAGCTATIGAGRLAELGTDVAATTPRYLMPSILLAGLGIAALMTPSGAPARVRVPGGRSAAVAAAGVAALAFAALYAANLKHTYDGSAYSRLQGQGAKAFTNTFERSARAADGAARASIVDGGVPNPVYYPDDYGDLASLAPFFKVEPPLAGVPRADDRTLSAVAADGAIAVRNFDRRGGRTRCSGPRCTITISPGAPADPLYAQVHLARPAPGGARVQATAAGGTPARTRPAPPVPIPPGATTVTIPAFAGRGATPLVVTVTATRGAQLDGGTLGVPVAPA